MTIATANFRVSETSAQLICNLSSTQVQTDKPEIIQVTLTVQKLIEELVWTICMDKLESWMVLKENKIVHLMIYLIQN